jgi:hypothetical protein
MDTWSMDLYCGVEYINTARFRDIIIRNIAHFTQMLNLNMNSVH